MKLLITEQLLIFFNFVYLGVILAVMYILFTTLVEKVLELGGLSWWFYAIGLIITVLSFLSSSENFYLRWYAVLGCVLGFEASKRAFEKPLSKIILSVFAIPKKGIIKADKFIAKATKKTKKTLLEKTKGLRQRLKRAKSLFKEKKLRYNRLVKMRLMATKRRGNDEKTGEVEFAKKSTEK